VHARKTGVESFEKREKDVKRGKSMSMKKKERKNRKVKKEKNMCMREIKIREREKRSGKKDMRGMNQVKEK
jgi:hypothetical protein